MTIICEGCGHSMVFHTLHGCQHYGCGCNAHIFKTIISDRSSEQPAHTQTKE